MSFLSLGSIQRAPRPLPQGLQVETAPASRPTFLAHPNQENSDIVAVLGCVHEVHGLNTETPVITTPRVLRVTNVRLCCRAVAARRPSITARA